MDASLAVRRRGGQVLIVFAVSVVILCCLLALAVDVGCLTTSQARLQNGADAAALGTLLELWEQRAAGAEEQEARTVAEAEAADLVGHNRTGGAAEVEFGTWDGSLFTPVAHGVPANAVRVRSLRDATAPGGTVATFFGRFLGVEVVDQSAQAIARFQHKKLIPFCIYEDDVPGPGGDVTVYDDTIVAPGVFGLLDFDGGENSSDDQKNWVEYGYEGPFYIDPATGSLVIEGNPGFVASLDGPINDHIDAGDQVVACVYRDVWGGGAGTFFEVVGFVTLVLTDEGKTKIDGEPTKYVTGEVVSKYFPGTGQTQGAMRDIMHLRLVQ